MKRIVKLVLLAAGAVLFAAADFAPQAPLGLTYVREAAAIIGAPLTPMSYAGVARRTTRRVAYAETAAVTTAAATTAVAASSQQAAVAQQQAAVAQQQAAAAQQQALAAGSPAIGTVVPALPAGCTAAPVGGVEYYKCGGAYYRAAFQGNNLVYVVAQP